MSHGSSSTTSPTLRVRVPRHVARLVIDYFAYAARPGASARRAARRRLLHLRHAIRCLGSLHGSSSTFAYAVRPGASARRTARRRSRIVSLLDFSSVGRTSSRRARGCSVSRLNYSVRGHRDFVLQPHWLHFSHAVRRDYLSRGNTGCTSSTPRAATTSSSSRIASTTHLD
jgi:hypothetical protein